MQSGMASVAKSVAVQALGLKPQLRVIVAVAGKREAAPGNPTFRQVTSSE